ncbi:MAG: hypothetical protein QOE06_3589 [Thermoleophilaceae bacterium]|jgi:hypothetical protein|nr:hypothetical protein [Thermoleophilaceae bacterium]
MDDDAIRELVARLARPHPSGGEVIERAAILASGVDSADVIAWITAHAGKPEMAVSSGRGGGLHGTKVSDRGEADALPLRFVLPAGALG